VDALKDLGGDPWLVLLESHRGWAISLLAGS
jgi:hypothetical protein